MMNLIRTRKCSLLAGGFFLSLALLAGCAAPKPPVIEYQSVEYVIGAGDTLQIFVWRNPEVSITVPVRPDGKISTPLVEDMVASGKTPTQLAREIERVLAGYLKDPLVTVIVTAFSGAFEQQIRVVGEVTLPSALMYRADMTLLDVMIQVGGLTDFAAGNRSTIVRTFGGQQHQFRVRLNDLVRNGDVSANVAMMPGDVVFVPESWF